MALILIVDDSPTEVHVMQKALERHGYRTAVAGDGAEGIRLARQMHPDLIFMDIVMPGVNGYQATRTLLQRPGHPRHSDRHGDFQGTGDRSHLGLAPGGGRLHGQAGVAGPAWSRRRRPRSPPEHAGERTAQGTARPAVRTPRRARAAWPQRHRQPRDAEAARRGEWVGVALRMAGELYLVAREEAREVLGVPSPLTRVPGAKTWILGLASIRGQLLPIIDLRPVSRRRSHAAHAH